MLQISVQDLMTIRLCVSIMNTALIIKFHDIMKSRITNQSCIMVKIGCLVIKTLYSKDNSSSNTFNLITTGLHIGYSNIQHLFPKLDEIKFILNENNSPDLFGLKNE